VTVATAPATTPRTDVATDDNFDGDFFAAGLFLDRDAAARAAVFRFAALRLAGARRGVDRLVAVRRVDFLAFVRALLRLPGGRFDMMNGDYWLWR
jgi:hypothetical protein